MNPYNNPLGTSQKKATKGGANPYTDVGLQYFTKNQPAIQQQWAQPFYLPGTVPKAGDKQGLIGALSYLDKLNKDDQVRVISRAANAGVADRNKSADAIRSLIKGEQTPVKYSLAEKAAKATISAGKAFVQPFRDIASEGVKNIAPVFGPTRSQQGLPTGQTAIQRQQTAQKTLSPQQLQASKGLTPSQLGPLLDLVQQGKKGNEIDKYLQQAAQQRTQQIKKGAGTAAVVSSLAIGGGGLGKVPAAFSAGGTRAVAPILGRFAGAEGVSGALAAGGTELARPGSTFKSVATEGLKGGLAGAGLGLAVGGVSSKLGKAMNKANLTVPGATAAIPKTSVASSALGVRVPRADVPVFGGKVDSLTKSKTDALIKQAEQTPVEPGKIRVFQSIGKGGQTDFVADNVDRLISYKNATTTSEDVFKFIDVTPQQLQKTVKGADIYQLKSTSGQVPNIPSTIATGGEDSIAKITNALNQMKPLSKEQAKLYSKERAVRAGKLESIGQTVQGEKGFYAQLGALKGQLPKAQFESIRKQFDKGAIDDLYKRVQTSDLSVYEKVNAQKGLSKLLGETAGVVPNNSELALLKEVYGEEFTQAVLGARPAIDKFKTAGVEIFNLPRAIMTTVDLSAPFRQGAFLISKPKQFAGAFKEMFKYAGSEKAYLNSLADIRSRPSYKAMRESGLALTDIKGPANLREEAFMSNLAEKIPGFGVLAKASDRAYTGFLNKLRADVFDDLYTKAKALGVLDERPGVVTDIGKFVNSASGRGDLGALNRSAVALNSVFFSPRLMASRLYMLNPVNYVNPKIDPFVRKEMIKSLIGFASAGSSVLALAKLGGADVGVDPRSSDFGKIKIGKTRYDPWGGFQQYVVLTSRLISGEMISSTTGKEIKLGEGYKTATRKDILERFLESKTAPVASFVNGILKGENFSGEKFNVPAEIADRFIPMMSQDIYDLQKEYGKKGIAMAIPGVFGIGSQTYGEQIPIKEKTATGRESVTFRNAPGLGEMLTNKIQGKQISNVPESEYAVLRKQKEVQTKWEDKLTSVKSKVLDSGKDEFVYNPIKQRDVLVYLKNGVVKTKLQ